MDTVKIWESMATQALLSGRKLVITYTTPANRGGIGWINILQLFRVP